MSVKHAGSSEMLPLTDGAAWGARNSFIVLVSLLQGLALYVGRQAAQAQWGLFAEPMALMTWYTLALAVPSMMTLTVQKLDDKRFWQHVIVISFVYALLAVWSVWNAMGVDGYDGDHLHVFALSAALGLFVMLPYLQSHLTHGRWVIRYPELFDHAWQNGLTLLLLIPFVGLCWLVLMLWGGLFALLQINFFRDLFREDAFIYMATGCMVGFGILVARTQQRPIQVLQLIVFSVFRGLLPVVSFIAVLFLAMLPITGLDPLWETGHATLLMLVLVELMIVATNATFLDGRRPSPYPPVLGYLVQAGLLSLPIFAGLTLYALWLRVDQYGWTPDRVCAMLLATLMAVHALGYAYAAVPRRAGWLGPLPIINVSLSLVALGLVLLVNSPVLDPLRLSVQSQVDRLKAGVVKPEGFDFEFLRREAGRPGMEALRSLRSDPLIKKDAAARAHLERALDPHPEEVRVDNTPRTVEFAQQHIKALAGVKADDVWWSAIATRKLPSLGCLTTQHSDCMLLGLDLHADQTQELLLCDLSAQYDQNCLLFVREAGWQAQAELHIFGEPHDSAVIAALREGRITTKPRRWPDLEVGGRQIELTPCDNGCGPSIPEPDRAKPTPDQTDPKESSPDAR